MSTVWVLGAGFSRPLGGPLLTELLTDTSESILSALYPKDKNPKLHNQAAKVARALFAACLSDPNYNVSQQYKQVRLWKHAEEYLDQLDAAASEKSPHHTRMHYLIERIRIDRSLNTENLSLRHIADAARRLVGAECCAFISDEVLKTERWTPYQLWFDTLNDTDTIITFNYDRVIESLGTDSHVIDAGVRRSRTGPRLLKLHGSVDWVRVGRTFEPTKDHEMVLRCKDEELAIATPGPSKLETSTGLKQLWDEAKAALKKAKSIIFVGFRFPESDAHARRELLGAISGNAVLGTLRLHVVLGPNKNDPAIVRLARLLEFACDRRLAAPRISHHIGIHPMWAEDFISLYDRSMFSDA